MTDKAVLDAYRMQLRHYYNKGIGEQSDLSKNTTITAKLVIGTLERYLELGGTLDFIKDFDMDEYNKFIEDVKSDS